LDLATPPAKAAPIRADGDSLYDYLREVKDPFRTALASRLLPSSSRLRVLHVGKALSDDMAEAARAEADVNPRYHWLGELQRWHARQLLPLVHPDRERESWRRLLEEL
jgi:hypothetical protein